MKNEKKQVLINETDFEAVATKMTFKEYVEAECQRQWKELQEEENGPWENLPENERKTYFEEMYAHLLPQKEELCDMDDIID